MQVTALHPQHHSTGLDGPFHLRWCQQTGIPRGVPTDSRNLCQAAVLRWNPAFMRVTTLASCTPPRSGGGVRLGRPRPRKSDRHPACHFAGVRSGVDQEIGHDLVAGCGDPAVQFLALAEPATSAKRSVRRRPFGCATARSSAVADARASPSGGRQCSAWRPATANSDAVTSRSGSGRGLRW